MLLKAYLIDKISISINNILRILVWRVLHSPANPHFHQIRSWARRNIFHLSRQEAMLISINEQTCIHLV